MCQLSLIVLLGGPVRRGEFNVSSRQPPVDKVRADGFRTSSVAVFNFSCGCLFAEYQAVKVVWPSCSKKAHLFTGLMLGL